MERRIHQLWMGMLKSKILEPLLLGLYFLILDSGSHKAERGAERKKKNFKGEKKGKGECVPW